MPHIEIRLQTGRRPETIIEGLNDILQEQGLNIKHKTIKALDIEKPRRGWQAYSVLLVLSGELTSDWDIAAAALNKHLAGVPTISYRSVHIKGEIPKSGIAVPIPEEKIPEIEEPILSAEQAELLNPKKLRQYFEQHRPIFVIPTNENEFSFFIPPLTVTENSQYLMLKEHVVWYVEPGVIQSSQMVKLDSYIGLKALSLLQPLYEEFKDQILKQKKF